MNTNILFWNVRGLNRKGRKTQVAELETMLTKINEWSLRNIGRGSSFNWYGVMAEGHSGGMLVGVNSEKFCVEKLIQGRRFQYLEIREVSKKKWMLMNVYDPVRESEKIVFLEEIKEAIMEAEVDKIDKSSKNINRRSVNLFNQFVAETELRELCRSGNAFTWSNNQSNPVRVVLGRVFVDKEWEETFPLVSLQAMVRCGSDHNPLLVRTGEVNHIRNKIFKFEPAWLLVDGFREEVINRWKT
ncbi:hypothetical protein BS78_09G086100 [Paspalum vaginatum]|nr:hypothetical protein BS78_09G086100 [Paspalum vaginatum]